MRDLSLHILDLLENAVRAGATDVRVTIAENLEPNLLEVAVEDNGPGLGVAPDRAADPFFTTGDKRVGLGLSLFQEAAEAAEGSFDVGRSELGGTAVRATMRLDHVDRKPLGNLAESLFAIACTHPETEVQCILRTPNEERALTRERQPLDGADILSEARRFSNEVRSAVEDLFNGKLDLFSL